MKRHILFVDDQVELLEGLRRSLRPLREVWEPRFATSGVEALAVLDEWPAQAVVSDMRMPGMDGAELLGEVMRRHPLAVRIMLSGQSDDEAILRAVGPVHQYLSKPCSPELLKQTLDRSCALRERLRDPALLQLVSQVTRLPSMPSIFLRLMEELKAPESAVDNVASLIARDVGMTCKLLQLVNSSFFGLPRRIESAEHAARLLGLERLRPLVLSAGIFSQFDGMASSGLSLDRISEHGLATSVLAGKIVELESRDATLAQDASLAGILVDVGQLVLLQSHGRRYVEVVEQARRNGEPLCEAEIREFGASHAVLGAYLLSLWGMPDSIVEAAAFHHTPRESSHRGFSLLAAVHVADALDHDRHNSDDPSSAPSLDLDFLEESKLADRLPVWQQAANSARSQVKS